MTGVPIPLVEQVGVLGEAVWIEERLFELEGRWSMVETDAEVAVHLATNSRYHGDHAVRLADCLPDSPVLDAEGHVRSPSPGWEAVLVEPLELPEGSWARLVVVERVLARTVPGYEELANRLTMVADGPTLRALDHVLTDQRAELTATRALVVARVDAGLTAVLGEEVDARLEGSV